jgi:hypothetical protein
MNDYDERNALRRWVFAHHGDLMTEDERHAWYVGAMRTKTGAMPAPPPDIPLDQPPTPRCVAIEEDLAADQALEGGLAALMFRICDRILKEHGDSISVHRCPDCDRVLRTSEAQWCEWCGHDWHGKSP